MTVNRNILTLGEIFIEATANEQAENIIRASFDGFRFYKALAFYRRSLRINLFYCALLGHDDSTSKETLAHWQQLEVDWRAAVVSNDFQPCLRLEQKQHEQVFFPATHTSSHASLLHSCLNFLLHSNSTYHYLLLPSSLLVTLDSNDQERLLAILAAAQHHNSVIVLFNNSAEFDPFTDCQEEAFYFHCLQYCDLLLSSPRQSGAVCHENIEKLFHDFAYCSLSEICYLTTPKQAIIVNSNGTHQVNGEAFNPQPSLISSAQQDFFAGYLVAKIKGLSAGMSARCGFRLMNNSENLPTLF